MCTRVYVGHLSSRATERDIESFCKGIGKVRDVVLKNGFGFIEFEDSRDAEDACSELNGRDLCGERVIVELSRGKERGGGRRDGGYRDSYSGGGRGGDRYGGGYGGGRDGGGYGGGRGNLRYGPPVQTKYRLVVENLSTRCSWQDLKDMMRKEGEATYCDAHKKEKNLALVCFASHSDLKRAMKAYQGKDINGRKIKLIDDTQSGGGRSRSRSHSPRSRRRRSPSRSKSPRDSRSRSPASRSKSKSRSPASHNGRDSRSRSPPAKRSSHSRSASVASSAGSKGSKESKDSKK